MTKEGIENTLFEQLQPVTEGLMLQLVDVELIRDRNDSILRIYLDKEGGVGIDDCEEASKAFDPILDELDLIREAYTLEVSSPGVGRPIVRPRDFVFALGKEIDLHTYKAIDKQKEFRGVLTGYDEESVTIQMGEEQRVIARREISRIQLAFDF